jgi:hypothetical protein
MPLPTWTATVRKLAVMSLKSILMCTMPCGVHAGMVRLPRVHAKR